MLPAMSRLVDLTATSKATLWWTLQDLRKSRVECAENSGPPSEVRVGEGFPECGCEPRYSSVSRSASWNTDQPALSTTLPHGGRSRRRYAGRGSMAGWEGALLLHTAHLLLVSAMSLDMPGQNSEVWARAVIRAVESIEACLPQLCGDDDALTPADNAIDQ